MDKEMMIKKALTSKNSETRFAGEIYAELKDSVYVSYKMDGTPFITFNGPEDRCPFCGTKMYGAWECPGCGAT